MHDAKFMFEHRLLVHSNADKPVIGKHFSELLYMLLSLFGCFVDMLNNSIFLGFDRATELAVLHKAKLMHRNGRPS